MSKSGIVGIIVFIILGGFLFWYVDSIPTDNDTHFPDSNTNLPTEGLTNDLLIASWNLQIFGQSKASDPVLMNKYASEISKYDVVFVQEIRDISETSFTKLCDLLPGYSCLTSSRAGRSSSKEQYGIIYKKGVIVLEWSDYNTESYQTYFERPPVKAVIQIIGKLDGVDVVKNLTVWVNHLKPEDVSNEMTVLEQIVYRDSTPNEPLIILGDLNADCTYYNNANERQFDSLFWIIGDDEDTTVAATDCAYDRIITNFGVGEYGINKEISKDMSDHYLVWLQI